MNLYPNEEYPYQEPEVTLPAWTTRELSPGQREAVKWALGLYPEYTSAPTTAQGTSADVVLEPSLATA